jgi:hypothetical protein
MFMNRLAAGLLLLLVAASAEPALRDTQELPQKMTAEVSVKVENKLIVLSGPSLISKRLGTVKAGDTIRILAYHPAEHFFSIRYKQRVAYVDASQVPRTEELQQLVIDTQKSASGNALPTDAKASRLDNQTARLQVLTMLYGERAAKKILAGKTWVGMTKEMVVQSLGEPKRRRRVDFTNIIKEHWEYADGLDLYFENDLLKAIGGLPPGVQPLEPPGVPPGATVPGCDEDPAVRCTT